jgi:hypothetical protein
MAAPASAKAELAAIIDAMTTEEAERLLDYLHMLADPDELTPEEEAEVLKATAEIEAGDYVTQEEVELEYGLRA